MSETSSSPPAPETQRVNAGCVAVDLGERSSAALIRGPSGSGKSSLALRLIALGARLVSDDWTVLTHSPSGGLEAAPPPNLAGLIEARGVGVLRLPYLATAPVRWVVELTHATPPERLPPARQTVIAGCALPLLRLRNDDHAAAAVFCLLQGGALLDPDAPLAEIKGGS